MKTRQKFLDIVCVLIIGLVCFFLGIKHLLTLCFVVNGS